MKVMIQFLTIAALLAGSSTTFAAPLDAHNLSLANYAKLGFSSAADMKNHFTIKNVTVSENAPELTRSEMASLFQAAQPPAKPLDPIGAITQITGVDISAWVTLGQKLWQVVLDNKPIANVATQRVSVLPIVQQNWSEMENWKGPEVRSFTIAAANAYGATVISHTYTVAFNYGGQYGGHGAFVANATVIPTKIAVSWGFELNSQVEVGSVLNTGTKADPIPGLELQLQHSMDSILSHLEGRTSFFVRGDGSVTHVTAGAN